MVLVFYTAEALAHPSEIEMRMAHCALARQCFTFSWGRRDAKTNTGERCRTAQPAERLGAIATSRAKVAERLSRSKLCVD